MPEIDLLEAVEAEAYRMRAQARLALPGWYVRYPAWLVYGNGLERFCQQFDALMSDHVVMSGLGNLRGFETDAPGGGIYMYTLPWLDETPTPPTR